MFQKDRKAIKTVATSLLILVFFTPHGNAAAPVSPTGLMAIAGNGEASLTWNAVSGATGYILYRGTQNGGPYGFLAETQGTGYTDRGITNASTYYYAVTALNADGQSAYSAQVSLTPIAEALPAPTGLTALAGNGQVSLVWNPVTSAVSYNVYRATSKGGPYTVLTPTAPGTSFTDKGVANGTQYYYVVQTLSTNPGAYSNEVSATPSGSLPVAPAIGLTAIAGNHEASLTWNAVPGATNYVLYRGMTSGGHYSFVAETQGTGYSDRGIENGYTYVYVVTALNADGQSAYSASINVTPVAEALPAPNSLAAIPGNGQISLVWDKVTSAVSYNVYRAPSRGGPYTLLTPSAPGPSFTDRELTNGTQYFYVVQTMSTNPGAYSDEVSAIPSALVPIAPATFAAVPGSTWASLSWSPSDGATAYAIYRGTAVGGPYSFVALPNTTTYEDTGLENGSDGTDYYYVIAAVNAKGRGAFSAEASATVSASKRPHAAFLIASPGDGRVDLCWNSPPGAVSYTLYKSTTSGANYTSLGIQSPCFGDTGLSNGTTYYYVVDSHNASDTIVRSNEVAVTPVAKPSAPTNVAVITGNTQATVTWDPAAGTDGYVTISQSPGGPAISGSGYSYGKPSFTATGLTNNITYYFRVQSTVSQWSAASASVSATPAAALPLAPAGLGVTPGNRQLSIKWDAVAGATGYKVYRRTKGSAWSSEPIGTPTGTLFTDTGLTNGTTYYYIVAAVNVTGTGAWATGETYGTPTASAVPAPTNVAVTPGNMQATVTWDPLLGTEGYVTIATSPGGPAISGSGYSYGKPSFTATNLTNGTPYYFRVQFTVGQWSAYFAEVSATPAADRPLAPAGLGITPGNTQLSLAWTAVAGATGYKVFRRTEGRAWSSEPLASPTATLFTDTGLANGTKYYYIVAAVNAVGSGAWATGETYGTPTASAVPAPTNVAVTPGNTQATVTWDPIVGTEGYVTIATSPGGPEISGGYSYGKPSFTATGLTNGKTYYFRVRFTVGQWSAYSAEVSTTPLVKPPLTPANLGITPGNTQLSLTWTAVAGATGYKVYRRTEGSSWSSVPIGTPTATLFTDTGLANGTTYYYIVAAVNADGTGAWASSETYGTPTTNTLPAPVNIAVIPGNTQATVTWDPVVGATNYYVTAATSPGGPAIAVSGASGGKPSGTVAGLTNGKTYYFRVQSNVAGGQYSAYSAEASAAPLVELPLTPTDLGIAAGNAQLSLTWTKVTGATSYKVYRRTEGSAWSSAPIGTPTATLFTDTGLTNGTTYYYSVAAVNATGTGAWSNEAYGAPTAAVATAPVNVAVTPGNQQATITWSPVAGATAYYVTVSTSPGGAGTNKSGNTSTANYIATGLNNGQTYYFRVQSVKNQFSAFSAEVSAVPNPEANLGNISGRVSVNFAGYGDLGVKNATVSLEGTSYSTTSDASGNFILLNIPFGSYKLVVAAPNMDTVRSDISLTGQSLTATIPSMVVTSALKGDANGDDKITMADVIYLLQILSGTR